MKRLRTAIVGSGKVAHLHAAALKSLPQSEFVGVCGRPSEKLDSFGRLHGVPTFGDLGGMLRDTRAEALCICTPHPNHAASAVAAARQGVHVLVEKPLAATLEDCDAILTAARQGGARIGVVSQRRFYPPCQRIREAIDAGKIGKPVLGTAVIYGWRDEAYYRSDPWRGRWDLEGGGILVNQAPHQLDLLLWYMGEVEEVFGYWSNLNHPTIEVEDTAVASVRFKSGALGSIIVSNSQNPALHARVLVNGSNGASVGVQTDGGAMFIAGVPQQLEPPYNDVWTIKGDEGRLEAWKAEDSVLFASSDPLARFHRLQVEDFLSSVLEGRPAASEGADGRRVVELFTGIYRSMRLGRPVRFPLDPIRNPASDSNGSTENA
jgi:predicted dehydrogenase